MPAAGTDVPLDATACRFSAGPAGMGDSGLSGPRNNGHCGSTNRGPGAIYRPDAAPPSRGAACALASPASVISAASSLRASDPTVSSAIA